MIEKEIDFLILKVRHHLSYKKKKDALKKRTIMKGIAIILKHHHITLKLLIKKIKRQPILQKEIYHKVREQLKSDAEKLDKLQNQYQDTPRQELWENQISHLDLSKLEMKLLS